MSNKKFIELLAWCKLYRTNRQDIYLETLLVTAAQLPEYDTPEVDEFLASIEPPKQVIKQPVEGWNSLNGSRKWHYFNAENKSLCGRWFILDNRGAELGNNNSSDNCAACRKKLAKNVNG